jgi:hypothetical protein
MPYEFSKFGNGVASGSGGNVVENVHNRFGQQFLHEQIGVNESTDGTTQVTLTLTGRQLQRDVATNDAFLRALKLPVGAVIVQAIAQVKEAFALGGTSPTINLGTEGSEVTNGITLTQAQAQAIGTYALTRNGTWANPIATAADVGVALGGTSPTVTSVGRVDILIEYKKA